MKALSLPRDGHPRYAIDPVTGCWNWEGTLSSEGYGLLMIQRHRLYAHIVSYSITYGRPLGKPELDHLCRNRKCINPDHLEPVTSLENSLRGNHPLFTLHRNQVCAKGHDLTIPGSVLEHGAKKKRRCTICCREYQREYRARKQG